MSEWISVDEDMPDECGFYLCAFEDGTIETFPIYDHEIQDIEDGFIIEWGIETCHVTHWTPLPDPPNA
jgi:hypothetical protein